jgi:ABC-type sugar transport system ATPase subunit
LIQVGTPHEIYNTPNNTFVASFVGAPAINLFDIALDLPAGTAQDGALGFTLEPATRARLNALPLPNDRRVRVGVRPEDVKLVAAGGITGTIYGAEHHGVEIIAIIQAGDHKLRATIRADSNVTVNQVVQFSFTQDKLHFFNPLTGDSLGRH